MARPPGCPCARGWAGRRARAARAAAGAPHDWCSRSSTTGWCTQVGIGGGGGERGQQQQQLQQLHGWGVVAQWPWLQTMEHARVFTLCGTGLAFSQAAAEGWSTDSASSGNSGAAHSCPLSLFAALQPCPFPALPCGALLAQPCLVLPCPALHPFPSPSRSALPCLALPRTPSGLQTQRRRCGASAC